MAPCKENEIILHSPAITRNVPFLPTKSSLLFQVPNKLNHSRHKERGGPEALLETSPRPCEARINISE